MKRSPLHNEHPGIEVNWPASGAAERNSQAAFSPDCVSFRVPVPEEDCWLLDGPAGIRMLVPQLRHRTSFPRALMGTPSTRRQFICGHMMRIVCSGTRHAPVTAARRIAPLIPALSAICILYLSRGGLGRQIPQWTLAFGAAATGMIHFIPEPCLRSPEGTLRQLNHRLHNGE